MTSQAGSGTVGGSEIVQESLSAQRTVASRGLEDHFYRAFVDKTASDVA